MENNQNSILKNVANYYTGKLSEFGDTPRGVDWNGEESQLLRFQQLLKMVDSADPFSIIDLGCGYGALYDYLSKIDQHFQYIGYDISNAMIEAAKCRYVQNSNAQFYESEIPMYAADYSVASGVFNVRLNHDDEEWWDYLTSILDVLHNVSSKGFSFNCLTSYSEREKMRTYLYYADPCVLFDFCKRRYSRNVALLHDYGLYEFTIIVKKT